MKHALAAALALALSQSAGRPDVRLPLETAGWENVVTALISVFDHADVLALGEAHGRKEDADLRVRLVRHPQFANRVRSIVVESADVDYGGLLDAARDMKLQLIANETPRAQRNRNQFAIDATRDRVAKGEKVLLVFGSGHLWHREGDITSALDRVLPGRTFVAEVLAPVNVRAAGREAQELDASLKALEDTVTTRERPVLISLRGTHAATLVADPFYLGQAMLSPSTTIGDLDDAVVYFGR
jgi:uncharacterized iron-regulated protein